MVCVAPHRIQCRFENTPLTLVSFASTQRFSTGISTLMLKRFGEDVQACTVAKLSQ